MFSFITPLPSLSSPSSLASITYLFSSLRAWKPSVVRMVFTWLVNSRQEGYISLKCLRFVHSYINLAFWLIFFSFFLVHIWLLCCSDTDSSPRARVCIFAFLLKTFLSYLQGSWRPRSPWTEKRKTSTGLKCVRWTEEGDTVNLTSILLWKTSMTTRRSSHLTPTPSPSLKTQRRALLWQSCQRTIWILVSFILWHILGRGQLLFTVRWKIIRTILRNCKIDASLYWYRCTAIKR